MASLFKGGQRGNRCGALFQRREVHMVLSFLPFFKVFLLSYPFSPFFPKGSKGICETLIPIIFTVNCLWEKGRDNGPGGKDEYKMQKVLNTTGLQPLGQARAKADLRSGCVRLSVPLRLSRPLRRSNPLRRSFPLLRSVPLLLSGI